MKVEHLEIEGLAIVHLNIFTDDRGFFTERYRRSAFEQNGLPTDFAQDNHSRSESGVLRGLHFQYAPVQGKLVGVGRGRIWDVAVDLRQTSPSFGQHFGVELSDKNGKLLWIPPGFAHGFCVLGDESADVIYKATTEYNPQTDVGIIWSDPELAIEWPIATPELSERDRSLQTFADFVESGVDWP